VAVRELAPASQDLSSVVGALNSSRNGVMQIAVVNPTRAMGHMLNAVYDAKYGVKFLDTNGRVFNGMREFLAAYPGYSLAPGWPMIFYESTIMFTVGQASQLLGGFSAIGLEVRGIAASSLESPIGGGPPRSTGRP